MKDRERHKQKNSFLTSFIFLQKKKKKKKKLIIDLDFMDIISKSE
jgi:hypothetical protein